MKAMTVMSDDQVRPNRTYEERVEQLAAFCAAHGRRPSINAPTREERSLAGWVKRQVRREMVTPALTRVLETTHPTPAGKKIFSHRDEIRLEYRLDELERFCHNNRGFPFPSRDYPVEATLHNWVYTRIRSGKIPPRLQVLIEQYPDTVPGRAKGTGRA